MFWEMIYGMRLALASSMKETISESPTARNQPKAGPSPAEPRHDPTNLQTRASHGLRGGKAPAKRPDHPWKKRTSGVLTRLR